MVPDAGSSNAFGISTTTSGLMFQPFSKCARAARPSGCPPARRHRPSPDSVRFRARSASVRWRTGRSRGPQTTAASSSVDGRLDRPRPGARLLVRDERHRRRLAGAMAGLAVGLQDREDVFIVGGPALTGEGRCPYHRHQATGRNCQGRSHHQPPQILRAGLKACTTSERLSIIPLRRNPVRFRMMAAAAGRRPARRCTRGPENGRRRLAHVWAGPGRDQVFAPETGHRRERLEAAARLEPDARRATCARSRAGPRTRSRGAGDSFEPGSHADRR